MADETVNPFEEGLRHFLQGDTASAQIFFEEAATRDNPPLLTAYLAFCMAKEQGEVKKGISLVLESIRQEPRNSELYLLLGKIHLLAGQKSAAIRVFRLGLRYERNQRIHSELGALGIRRRPPLPFLTRSNPINKYLGIFLKKAGLR